MHPSLTGLLNSLPFDQEHDDPPRLQGGEPDPTTVDNLQHLNDR